MRKETCQAEQEERPHLSPNRRAPTGVPTRWALLFVPCTRHVVPIALAEQAQRCRKRALRRWRPERGHGPCGMGKGGLLVAAVYCGGERRVPVRMRQAPPRGARSRRPTKL